MGELDRRLVHASGIGFPALYLLALVTWGQLRLLLVIGSGVALVLEFLRLRGGLEWRIYDTLTRPYEADRIAGYALYMLSVTAVALVFSPRVALPAMLMLMIGDPVSGLLATGGLRRIKAPRALAAMFAVCLVLAIPFALATLETTSGAIVAAGVAAGLATLADAVKPVIRGHVVDDNLTIPAAGAIGLWLAYRVIPLVA